MTDRELDALSINTLRFLAVDAVEKAKSGHPGSLWRFGPRGRAVPSVQPDGTAGG